MQTEETSNPVTMAKVLEDFDVTYRGDGDFFEASIVIDGPMTLGDACTFRVQEQPTYSLALQCLADHYEDKSATVDFLWGFHHTLSSALQYLRAEVGDPTHLKYLELEEDEMGYKDVIVINIVFAALRKDGKQHMSYRITTQAAKMLGDDASTCIDGPELKVFPPVAVSSAAAPTAFKMH